MALPGVSGARASVGAPGWGDEMRGDRALTPGGVPHPYPSPQPPPLPPVASPITDGRSSGGLTTPALPPAQGAPTTQVILRGLGASPSLALGSNNERTLRVASTRAPRHPDPRDDSPTQCSPAVHHRMGKKPARGLGWGRRQAAHLLPFLIPAWCLMFPATTPVLTRPLSLLVEVEGLLRWGGLGPGLQPSLSPPQA